MRGLKVALIAVGVLVAFLLVGTVVGVVIHAVIDLAIAALVVGGIVVAIKIARSNKQVTGRSKSKDSEIRDHYTSPEPLPRSDLDTYTAPRYSAPPPPPRAASPDVDDELARLKREMGS
jgi:hypothetical protein